MPDIGTLALFVVAALSMNLTPGPDMLYVVARSIGQGRRAGVLSVLGLSVGYVVYTLIAASGLAALLQSSPLAFNVIRYLGAAYLAYLGVRTIRTRAAAEASGVSGQISAAGIFRQGALTSTLNPGIAVFFLAFLPQFVDATRGDVALQIILLGLIFNTTTILAYTLIALLTGSAGEWLRRRPGFGRGGRWFSGLVLIALGVRVLFLGEG